MKVNLHRQWRACQHVQRGETKVTSVPAKRHSRPCRKQSLQTRASLSYKDAGVDIDAGAELVRRIQKLNPSIGGFSGLVPFGEIF